MLNSTACSNSAEKIAALFYGDSFASGTKYE